MSSDGQENAPLMGRSAKQPPRSLLEFRMSSSSQHAINAAITRLSDACSKLEAQPAAADLVIWIDGVWAARPWPNEVTIQDIARWERSLRRLEQMDALVVTVVSGACGGPEFELALVGNYCVASPQAKMCPPMNDGLYWPGMSLYRLVDRCGVARARQIILDGRAMEAEPCMQAGIFDEISDDLNSAVERVRNGTQFPRELAIRRRLIADAASTPYEEAIGSQLAACDRELRRMYPSGYRR